MASSPFPNLGFLVSILTVLLFLGISLYLLVITRRSALDFSEGKAVDSYWTKAIACIVMNTISVAGISGVLICYSMLGSFSARGPYQEGLGIAAILFFLGGAALGGVVAAVALIALLLMIPAKKRAKKTG